MMLCISCLLLAIASKNSIIPFDDTPCDSGVLRGSGWEITWRLTKRKSKTVRIEFLWLIILENCSNEKIVEAINLQFPDELK